MQKSVELSPKDTEGNCNLGATQNDLGELVEAEVSFMKALEEALQTDILRY